MHWWQALHDARAIGDIPVIDELAVASGEVRPGCGFAAVPGSKTDGHRFIEAAIRAGAPVCVVQSDRATLWSAYAGQVPLLVVPDVRAALGPLAAAVHDHPSAKLRLVGVTGTDGKTTSTHLIAHVLQACGLDAGYLSSVGFETGSGFELNPWHMTTLEATTVQSLLARSVAGGRRTMVVEASSEGLAQRRLDACEIDVAVFTNLTRDHLDFHGTMEAYRNAKGRLFEMLDIPTAKRFPRAAVLNADDPVSAYMQTLSQARVITYGIENEAGVRAREIGVEGFGLRFVVEAAGETLPAYTPLVGRFNVYNSLAAIAVATSQGLEARHAIEALLSFPGVPGRMERIECGQAFRVFVDIASTPAALENVLEALRPSTEGRLWVVFGAAGGRDPARRAGMGEVAGRLADVSVLTNEDPRDEDPDSIIETIASGLRTTGRSEGDGFVRVPDREEAIRYAFEHAGPGDTVLLAGKATEPTMIFAGGPVPWDERFTARRLLGG
ncbi:MAG TPA: UDP-N-acetylmuramoyl-L-alanyl-D-glutamate--2,6-diaminopimelate ligase [Dehalococcoidia bacterium]|nr:UDP-N-acetylmuramoyl-L-alanyl-D-glutamate--2,6-diaminopimelate ligase [Dehalococcoidia bacterium]